MYIYMYVCTRNGLDEGSEEVMCADAQTIHGLWIVSARRANERKAGNVWCIEKNAGVRVSG